MDYEILAVCIADFCIYYRGGGVCVLFVLYKLILSKFLVCHHIIIYGEGGAGSVRITK